MRMVPVPHIMPCFIIGVVVAGGYLGLVKNQRHVSIAPLFITIKRCVRKFYTGFAPNRLVCNMNEVLFTCFKFLIILKRCRYYFIIAVSVFLYYVGGPFHTGNGSIDSLIGDGDAILCGRDKAHNRGGNGDDEICYGRCCFRQCGDGEHGEGHAEDEQDAEQAFFHCGASFFGRICRCCFPLYRGAGGENGGGREMRKRRCESQNHKIFYIKLCFYGWHFATYGKRW